MTGRGDGVTGRTHGTIRGDGGLRRLREAWAALAEPAGAGDGAGCPAVAAIWDAAHGRGAPTDRGRIAEHIASCGSCALAWRIAAELAGTLEARPEPAAVPGAFRGPIPPASRTVPGRRSASRRAARAVRIAGVAAAVLLGAVGVGVMLRGPADPSRAYRALPGAVRADAIRPLVPVDAVVPRSEARLAWTPGPEGCLYHVRIATESLRVLARARGLSRPEYVVPADALAPLPAGARVLWQVDVVTPDGQRIVSDTFAVRLR